MKGASEEVPSSDEAAVTTVAGPADQVRMPAIGFGTYRIGGYQCYEAVKTALECGYRHIDTAMAYENEAVVGRAIENSPVERSEIFLVTKLKGYPEFLQYDRIIDAAMGCLERLGTDYLDVLLLHWWHEDGDMEEVFAAMGRLVEENYVDAIGVSNFPVPLLERAVAATNVPLFTNQMLFHPYYHDEELLSYCRDNDIILTAYSPLAEGWIPKDPNLAVIGERYGKTAAQVALRWSLQQENVVPIPKTRTPRYAKENIDIFDFELTEEEMERVASLKGPWRYRLTAEDGPVTRFRAGVGPYVPGSIRERLPI